MMHRLAYRCTVDHIFNYCVTFVQLQERHICHNLYWANNYFYFVVKFWDFQDKSGYYRTFKDKLKISGISWQVGGMKTCCRSDDQTSQLHNSSFVLARNIKQRIGYIHTWSNVC